MTNDLIRCSRNRCFNCDNNGYCHALKNKDFEGGLCPFFKTLIDEVQELKANAEQYGVSFREYLNLLDDVFDYPQKKAIQRYVLIHPEMVGDK